MKYPAFVLPATLILGITLPAASSLASEGKSLYENNCTSCHDSSVFTRENRKVKSKAQLIKQVQRCNFALETQLFDEDMQAIAQYLNKNFYKF